MTPELGRDRANFHEESGCRGAADVEDVAEVIGAGRVLFHDAKQPTWTELRSGDRYDLRRRIEL
ncbi:MAG: hypothetical protein ABMA13_04315 [Chthoniobacteraceae bacterium]